MIWYCMSCFYLFFFLFLPPFFFMLCKKKVPFPLLMPDAILPTALHCRCAISAASLRDDIFFVIFFCFQSHFLMPPLSIFFAASLQPRLILIVFHFSSPRIFLFRFCLHIQISHFSDVLIFRLFSGFRCQLRRLCDAAMLPSFFSFLIAARIFFLRARDSLLSSPPPLHATWYASETPTEYSSWIDASVYSSHFRLHLLFIVHSFFRCRLFLSMPRWFSLYMITPMMFLFISSFISCAQWFFPSTFSPLCAGWLIWLFLLIALRFLLRHAMLLSRVSRFPFRHW